MPKSPFVSRLQHRKPPLLLCSVFVVASVAGCGANEKPSPDASAEGSDHRDLSSLVIARVNEQPIFAEEFEEAYIQTLIRTGRQDTPQQRHATLQRLIQDRLLADQAESLGLPEAELDLFVERSRRKALADQFYRTQFMDTLSPPTEAQLRTAFYNTKTQVFVRQLYFEADQEQKAWDAWNRLEKGMSFADIANDIYGTKEYDPMAGYLGAIGYFSVDHAFAEAAFALKPGQYSQPVKTRLGISVILVDQRLTQPIITETEYEQKREGITGLVKERILSLTGDRFVRSTMESLNTQTDTANLRRVIQHVKGIEPNVPHRLSGEIVLRPKSSPGADDARVLLDKVDGSLPLVRYTVRTPSGPVTRTFTARDYAFWLPTLPLDEVKTRTAASVGRALRNHVFYEAAQGWGEDVRRGLRRPNLINDPYVIEKVRLAELEYKAWWVREQLASTQIRLENVMEGRGDATIEVDSVAFRSLMNYYQD